jgi:hypothetical protein
MSDEEKKISLDELPDEGSDPAPKNPPGKKLKKEEPDPRLLALKEKSSPQKIEVMEQKWYFDERVRNYGWVGFVMILSILEFTPFWNEYLDQINLANRNFFDVGGDILRSFTIHLEFFIRHPLALTILTPLFFTFSHTSEFAFELTFDGVYTVRKYLPSDSKEIVSRVMVKWKEIEKIEKKKVGEKEILKLYSLEGHIADIIWYISTDKKKAIRLLLQGMIASKHPLRVFLENEKELK